jgi:oligopeptide transport system permease protein
VTLGLTLGVLSADRPNGVLDHASMALAVFGVSLPTFVTGSLLILVFSISLGWLPVGGWGRPSNIILPAITLSMPFTAYIARLTRSAMLDELRGDYIRTARAKGLSRGEVLFSHAFRVAVLPVLGYIGPAAASILVGSFVVEKLFAAPGVGRYFVEAVLRRDYPLIIATVLVYSVMLVGFNLLADVAVLLADPRIARRGVS